MLSEGIEPRLSRYIRTYSRCEIKNNNNKKKTWLRSTSRCPAQSYAACYSNINLSLDTSRIAQKQIRIRGILHLKKDKITQSVKILFKWVSHPSHVAADKVSLKVQEVAQKELKLLRVSAGNRKQTPPPCAAPCHSLALVSENTHQ